MSDISKADEEGLVQDALKRSGADSFTARFPQGLDTYLTRRYDESGQELSGGQWQKIALLRAVYRSRADIMILDEPTAALDPRAEYEIYQDFSRLAEGKMTIFISHRMSSSRFCDHIALFQ